MNLNNIKEQYKTLLDFTEENENRWSLICPYFIVDGSMFEISLIRKDNKFYLTDDGYTLTNLNCLVDVECEDCVNVRREICEHFKVKELKDGSFEKEVNEENFFITLSQFACFCSQVESLVIYFN